MASASSGPTERIGQGNLPTRRGSDQSVSTGLPYDLTAAIALEYLYSNVVDADTDTLTDQIG